MGDRKDARIFSVVKSRVNRTVPDFLAKMYVYVLKGIYVALRGRWVCQNVAATGWWVLVAFV